jgi:deoxyribonuclease-4
MSAHFGPGGNSDAFRLFGGLSTLDAPAFVKSIGLDAYEYEAGNGLSASPSMLKAIGEEAKRLDVKMSFHTPYFISLSGIVEEKRLNSIKYIKKFVK